MTHPRHALPQLGSRIFLTDAGLETMLIFREGIELPAFAAFTLLDTLEGTEHLRRYFMRCLAHAAACGHGFLLEAPTWRASRDWGEQLGYTAAGLAELNRRAIALMHELRATFVDSGIPIVVSGTIGPRGDGYRPGVIGAPAAYEAYHREQIEGFARGAADMVGAYTLTNVPEAIGIARAAAAAEIPVAISFTVETDGRLPAGATLRDAIEEVDAATDRAPAYYMLNCAHPDHFEPVLDGGTWMTRLRGLRANASSRSHAELDAATTLDDGDPRALAAAYAALRRRFPQINVLGGCCGTDHRHVEAIAAACDEAAVPAAGRAYAA